MHPEVVIIFQLKREAHQNVEIGSENIFKLNIISF